MAAAKKKKPKNAMASKKGLELLGKVNKRVTREQVAKAKKAAERAARATPPTPPGLNAKKSRVEEERQKQRQKNRTGNVRVVPRGTSGMGRGGGLPVGRGLAGGGGMNWSTK